MMGCFTHARGRAVVLKLKMMVRRAKVKKSGRGFMVEWTCVSMGGIGYLMRW